MDPKRLPRAQGGPDVAVIILKLFRRAVFPAKKTKQEASEYTILVVLACGPSNELNLYLLSVPLKVQRSDFVEDLFAAAL